MFRSLAKGSLLGALALLAVLPVTASAAGGGGGGGSNGMTITIGKPITLQNRLLVTVPVTVTCIAPISVDPNLGQPGSIGLTVEQAVHNGVAVGSGGVQLLSCSPTPQSFQVQVTPFPGPGTPLPFHRGGAIASAGGGICDNNFPQTCYSDGTPWQTIRLI